VVSPGAGARLPGPFVSRAPEDQRRFYETREHAHLQPRDQDRYAARLVRELAQGVGIGRQDRVLEVGAGFGRFSFALLDHCRELVALDLSPRALAALEAERDRRGVPPWRCVPRCGDLSALAPEQLGERFPFVVGFFILHHLPDPAAAIHQLAAVLAPGGTVAFVEPNRRNPLFLAQVACAPDMSWAEERGMFRLRARAVEQAFRAAGLEVLPTRRFGFFPPQLVNRFATARRIEAAIEAAGVFEPVLPFLLLRARAPGAA
jgi:SAM-dependent methyltransferase